MKRIFIKVVVVLLAILAPIFAKAQNDWPKDIKAASGAIITLYQPQYEGLKGNVISSRTVVSVKKDKDTEPLFGVFWSDAMLLTNRDTRMSTIENLKITQLKFPDGSDSTKIELIKGVLESEVPKLVLSFPLDEIVATLETEDIKGSDEFNTTPPEIIYTTKLSTLVIIDGEPVVKMDDKLKQERVNNTPYLIIKNSADKKFYLSLGKFWYVANSVKGNWQVVKTVPSQLKDIDKQIQKNLAEMNKQSKADTIKAVPTEIVISTTPAELIQSNGEAQFASIEGTTLLYVSNSPDNIFKSIEDQQMYVLVSGRWFKAAKLEGPWVYVASDKLPADFAKIPEGSEKDEVLASVAGTEASKEAVRDAQIPQTAKVDRATTKCTVTYDGEPKFEPIENTSLEMAMNSSLTVLKSGASYYAVDNGVWFVATQPKGPWAVATDRPADVDKIPAENPTYNVKYVYVYDVTPEYVYVGYTPGYMGCYVYGPTVIYGTGYYYNPYYGPYYYPRPVTYGFSMYYNPYRGWSMGFSYSVGCVTIGIYGHPGYWGPARYYPPYHAAYHHAAYHHAAYHHAAYHHGGYYGRGGNTYNNINIDNSRNVYGGNRNGVSTSDVRNNGNRGNNYGSRGGNSVSTNEVKRGNNGGASASTRQNNVYSDRSGNVYRNDTKSGNYEQRSGNSWENKGSTKNNSQLNNSQAQRDRSTTRSSNYNSGSRPTTSGYSGGGSRGGSRGGGGRR